MSTNSISTLFLFIYFYEFNFSKTEKYPGFLIYYEPFKISNIVSSNEIDEQRYLHRIEFFAFNINFILFIKPGSQVINSRTNIIAQKFKNPITHINNEKILNYLIEGRVKDDPKSFVHGTFKHGILDGVIHTSNQTYFIENTKNYLPNQSNIFPSIIFRNSDLNMTYYWNSKREEHCKSASLNYLQGPLKNLSSPLTHHQAIKMKRGILIDHVPPRLPEDVYFEGPKKPTIPEDYRRNPVCVLNVIVDHTFYQNVGQRNFRKTAEEIIYLISEANRIFELTDFNGDGVNKDVTLQIKSMIIHKSASDPNYNLFDERLSAVQFLQKVSEYDFDGDCLGVAFAFRSFPKRVLGLSFIADSQPDRTLGGICQERRYLNLRKRSMSYNAAFVTVANQGIQLPRLMSVISLTHELGHSFGSFHDSVKMKQCSPSDKSGGLYIMSETAVSGHQQNNYKFSPCSLSAIRKVLQLKSKCFLYERPICGNGIAEAYEECDCGHPLQCRDIDHCCTPTGGIGKDAECTYRRQEGSKCSPKLDPCCTPDCTIISAIANHQCTGIAACRQEAFCDGLSAQCPASLPKRNGIACFDRTGLCIDGECIKPCKVKEGLFDCDCRQPEYSCHACCYSNNSTKCFPAIKFGIVSSNGLPLLKPRGELCDDGRGTCNMLGDCVEEYKYPKDVVGTNEESPKSNKSKERNEIQRLTTILIALLVLLCIGVMLCLLLCLAPFIKFLHQPVNNPDYVTIIQQQKKGVNEDESLNLSTQCNEPNNSRLF